MFSNQKIVEQLRDGKWETDCVHMEFIQNEAAAQSPVVLRTETARAGKRINVPRNRCGAAVHRGSSVA